MNQIVMLQPIDETLDECLELEGIEMPCPYCRVIAARERSRNIGDLYTVRARHRFSCSGCWWYLDVEEGSDQASQLVICAITNVPIPLLIHPLG